MLVRPLLVLALATAASAAPAQAVLGDGSAANGKPRPLVIWHGLGDTAHSKGMDQFANFVRKTYPGIFVHSVIAPSDGSPNEESKAGWVSERWASAVSRSSASLERRRGR